MRESVGMGGVIAASELDIGNNVTFGKDIYINVRGKLKIGDNSIIGDRFTATGEDIIIGEYFFNLPTDSRGMVIGGGSSNFPFAKLNVGNGMVCHTGHINLAKEVTIGNDVGLSHDVDILTHGFWASVVEGYPRKFMPVTIKNNVIVGWKTIILPGVNIASNTVIGAGSVIAKDCSMESWIYAGNPANPIKPLDRNHRPELLWDIVKEFDSLIQDYYFTDNFEIYIEDYPIIIINQLKIDVINKTCEGLHDSVTDAFRDFLRRYGIRIFHPRGFKFELERKPYE